MVELFDDLKDLQKTKLKADIMEKAEEKVEEKINLERDVADLQERVWKLERKLEEMCGDDDDNKGILDY